MNLWDDFGIFTIVYLLIYHKNQHAGKYASPMHPYGYVFNVYGIYIRIYVYIYINIDIDEG